MTKEEHITRAMLLGMVYREDIGVYFVGNRANGKQLDANTLKPLTFDGCIRRMKQKRETND